MELFGQCCVIAGAPAWPPSADARDTLAALCRNADTLKQYLQGCRAILALVRAPAGELVSTKALVQGARKAKPGGETLSCPCLSGTSPGHAAVALRPGSRLVTQCDVGPHGDVARRGPRT